MQKDGKNWIHGSALGALRMTKAQVLEWMDRYWLSFDDKRKEAYKNKQYDLWDSLWDDQSAVYDLIVQFKEDFPDD